MSEIEISPFKIGDFIICIWTSKEPYDILYSPTTYELNEVVQVTSIHYNTNFNKWFVTTNKGPLYVYADAFIKFKAKKVMGPKEVFYFSSLLKDAITFVTVAREFDRYYDEYEDAWYENEWPYEDENDA